MKQKIFKNKSFVSRRSKPRTRYLQFLKNVFQESSRKVLSKLWYKFCVVDSSWKHFEEIGCERFDVARKIRIKGLVEKDEIHEPIVQNNRFSVADYQMEKIPCGWPFLAWLRWGERNTWGRYTYFFFNKTSSSWDQEETFALALNILYVKEKLELTKRSRGNLSICAPHPCGSWAGVGEWKYLKGYLMARSRALVGKQWAQL